MEIDFGNNKKSPKIQIRQSLNSIRIHLNKNSNSKKKKKKFKSKISTICSNCIRFEILCFYEDSS